MMRNKLASTQISLEDIELDVVADHTELRNWGYWYRAESLPYPSTTTMSDILASMIKRVADPEQQNDPAHNPDAALLVDSVVKKLPEIYQRCLWAYYVNWIGSVRQCVMHMPITGLPRVRTKSEIKTGVDRMRVREFTRKLSTAEGIVLGALLVDRNRG